ncbi:acyltransferase family-domain-containing protein [Blyttiomyces helicus]|uniref:Acyltransferase family-domain-containing protein n=1 Tax=Blyttiomyces helicus TaxID=388810 RepID=A0A4V1IS76_9FUNG|nr:acyltransferase family-domain-containing protein [Blyttiomyces helicus]|eukprot:RKO92587.1 acyltransferase family-domain-containing protein [Blyttiomyces helicus]
MIILNSSPPDRSLESMGITNIPKGLPDDNHLYIPIDLDPHQFHDITCNTEDDSSPASSAKAEMPAQAQKLDWVDGLRGFAAWQVCNLHFLQPVVSGSGAHHAIQEILAGHNSVMLFFILSGRVLLSGFLKRRDPAIISSSAFRRPLRLGLPIYATLALHALLVWLGAYEINRPAREILRERGLHNWFNVPEARDVDHPALHGFGAFLWAVPRMVRSVGKGRVEVMFLYNELIPYPNRVHWTLPIELTQSYVLFALAIFATYISSRRWIMYFIVMFITWYTTGWTTPFAAGLTLADAAHAGQLAKLQTSRAWRLILHPLFLFTTALLWFLTSMRNTDAWLKNLSQTLLHKWVPDPDWNQQGAIGSGDFSTIPFWKFDNVVFAHALTLILAIELTPALQRVFAARIMRFLGNISYMLYLVHPLVHAVVPSLVVRFAPSALPNWAIVMLAYVVDMGVVVIAAWALYRGVDAPAVRAAQGAFDVVFKEPVAVSGRRAGRLVRGVVMWIVRRGAAGLRGLMAGRAMWRVGLREHRSARGGAEAVA